MALEKTLTDLFDEGDARLNMRRSEAAEEQERRRQERIRAYEETCQAATKAITGLYPALAPYVVVDWGNYHDEPPEDRPDSVYGMGGSILLDIHGCAAVLVAVRVEGEGYVLSDSSRNSKLPVEIRDWEIQDVSDGDGDYRILPGKVRDGFLKEDLLLALARAREVGGKEELEIALAAMKNKGNEDGEELPF